MRSLDLTGQRFDKLMAIRRVAPKGGDAHVRWECLCDCGKTSVVRGSLLKNGNTRSCGCLRKIKPIIHGHAGRNRHYLYGTWASMRARCNNPNDSSYARYGGRGVSVCSEWSSFERFLADVGNRPEGKTLDRIDPTGDYSASNCRWATKLEQRHNRRGGDACQIA